MCTLVEADLSLREILASPHALEIEMIRDEHGAWTRKLRYADIPDCTVSGEDVHSLIDEIERLRLSLTLSRLASGQRVTLVSKPLPEGPMNLSSNSIEEILGGLGQWAWLDRLDEKFPAFVEVEG